MRASSFALVSSLLLLATAFALEHPDVSKRSGCTYGYDDTQMNGPSHWSTACTGADACNNGKKQSPIDIVQDSSFEPQAAALNATYVEVDNLAFKNMGHTLQIFNNNTDAGLSGGPLTGFYKLVQMHFHAPSEHRWNGATYPFELHLVHSNAAGDKLAVLGFFFEHSASPNHFLSQLQDHVAEIPEEGNVTTVNAHLEILLRSVGSYYHYEGSLTTPPCSEIVDWLFSENVLKATPEQIEMFVAEMHGNNRPVQPLNNRLIQEFKAAGTTGASLQQNSLTNSAAAITFGKAVLLLAAVLSFIFA